MAIKRTTNLFKRIDEANALIGQIERDTASLEALRAIIGPTLCGLCKQPTPIQAFCYGCLEFICDHCQPPDMPEFIVAGAHGLDAHRQSRRERLRLPPEQPER